MYLKPGESPDITCDKCKDDRRDKPWMGLDIVRGMKRDGMNYKDGTILDPRNGNVYNAKMTLKPDGQTLVVRGYLGISLFGQDRIWTRLPESAYNEIDLVLIPAARNSRARAQIPDCVKARTCGIRSERDFETILPASTPPNR